MTDQDRRRPDDAPQREPFQVEHESETGDVVEIHAPIMRELSEPKDGYEPVPLALIFLFFGLIGWGGWYLGTYGANFDPSRYDHRPGAVTATAAETPEPLDPLTLGRRLYNACVACHQADGEGGGAFPPLNRSDWVQGPPETPVRILLKGLSGPIEVRGETYNDNMPAFGGRYDDREIAAVLTWVRQAWDNDAGPVDEALVAALREQHRPRTDPWSADDLRSLEGQPVPGYEPGGATSDGDEDGENGASGEQG